MYRFKEVTLKNGKDERNVLVIQFDEPEMEIIGEFLMTDANLGNYEVLDKIGEILSGERDFVQFNGNRCAVQITKNTTQIVDLFAEMFNDFDTLQPYEIDTIQLRELIEMWRVETNTFYKKH